jgi:hypothetical protein
MFQDYMRSRLGLGGVETPQPMQPIGGIPVANPNVPAHPPGFNPMPYHPAVNPTGWPGHPMNPGNNVETPTPQQAQPITSQPMKRQTGPFNPYAF